LKLIREKEKELKEVEIIEIKASDLLLKAGFPINEMSGQTRSELLKDTTIFLYRLSRKSILRYTVEDKKPKMKIESKLFDFSFTYESKVNIDDMQEFDIALNEDDVIKLINFQKNKNGILSYSFENFENLMTQNRINKESILDFNHRAIKGYMILDKRMRQRLITAHTDIEVFFMYSGQKSLNLSMFRLGLSYKDIKDGDKRKEMQEFLKEGLNKAGINIEIRNNTLTATRINKLESRK